MLGASPISPKRTVFTFGNTNKIKEERNQSLERELFDLLSYGSLTRGTILLNASFHMQQSTKDINNEFTYAMSIRAFKNNPGHKLNVKIEDRVLGIIKTYNIFSKAQTTFTAAIDFDKKIAKIFDDGICFSSIGRNQISILFLNPDIQITNFS